MAEGKDQLLIDNAILREAKRKKRGLSCAWVDYKKAYNMEPLSRILKTLETTKVAGNINAFLSNSMNKWETRLTANGKELSVKINRGIFQGDSLSPLQFIVAMLPLLLFILKRETTDIGYKFGSLGHVINHLFFMDDLKLFATSMKTRKN